MWERAILCYGYMGRELWFWKQNNTQMFETAYKRQIMKYGDLGLVVECKIVFQNETTFRNLKERVFLFKVQNLYKKNSIS
jgi:hypothetical protein